MNGKFAARARAGLPTRRRADVPLTTPGKCHNCSTRSVRERMHQLGAEALRERPVVDAVLVGKLAGRHVEGAEYDVEDREGRGKVFLAAAVRRRVVPAVKDRTCDDVFERTERPIEVSVDECRMGDR